MVYFLIAGLPLIAGLQRYAVAYGYQGMDRDEAWRSSWQTAAVIAFVETFIFMLSR